MKSLASYKKIIGIMFMAFIGVFLCTCRTYACTAIYVGDEASDNGTIIIGRSNDWQNNWANYVVLTEHVDNEPGRTMPVDSGETVLVEIPAETYKYISTPWMDATVAYNGNSHDAASAINEYGVAMTMSVTAFTNDEALAADPEPSTGISEQTANDLVICQSKTAREAVEVLLSLIDTYGSAESNIAIISDQNEAWYVEMYTGHQYAAVKLPRDKVAVFGNEYSLEYLSDYEDSIVSKDLETLAKDNNFAVYDKNGELNIMKTYAIDYINYSHMRTWIGHKLLAPSLYDEEYDQNTDYSLTFKADNKVSLKDAMEVLRNRFEGTEYSPDENGRIDTRVIGTDIAMSVHVLQIYPDLPSDMAVINWESTSAALYGAFVPFSVYETEIDSAYGLNQPAEETGNFDSDTYPWYAFKELNTLCLEDYRVYGNPVREYWSNAEENMIKGMKEVLLKASEIRKTSEDDASKYVTDYCNGLQDKAFSDAKELLKTVIWWQCRYANTMKVGKNPETHEATDEIIVHDPIEITMDGSYYAEVPEYTASAKEADENRDDIVIAVVVITIGTAIYFVDKKKKEEA